MDIVQMENTPVADTPHKVDVRKLYDTENAMTVHITLQPGESLKKHITPVDVFFYVLEGTGIVEIGDEKKEVGKDTLIDSPARIPHCWYNESDDVLRFLVVKVPRPTTETKLL
ncbi:cupin domain-containing protein [Methanobacterium formicicum]|jgi:mannose-6-phosphate isomerase-like protein (cupin superfamily)|uniref:Cupin domain-containing protein n=1 Tax=Methanobacterium formicicum TaxID=2162 RepID=A0A843APV7_METFO|nr:cupin domain-containing protein [Methanobacterium formicicum]MBF4475170.1 cupin domain-containing protein [Methanobacterium formicicum]